MNQVNGRFKTPVAYYFTAKANSDEQANIVRELLIMLSEIDAEVVSLTFDGAPSNIKTAELLGADVWSIDNLNCSFKHPSTGKPVSVLLDICHMLKLVRNILGNKGFIFDGEGGVIKWDYLVKLEQLQRHEGLLIANKLRLPIFDTTKTK